MEFLLTYGWALVVAILLVSALGYFGLLDAHELGVLIFPERCHIEGGISCLDHTVTSMDWGFGYGRTDLELILKNNLGEKIRIEKIYIVDYQSEYEPLSPFELNNGAQNDHTKSPFVFEDITDYNTNGFLPIGESYEIDFILTIENDVSKLTHELRGTIRGKVS
jgi:hypothetical protein